MMPLSKRRKHRLRAAIDAAVAAGDWSALERLAETRNAPRARFVGRRLARTAPAETSRFDGWLDSPRALTALHALAKSFRDDPARLVVYYERMGRRLPRMIEREMYRLWRARPEFCFQEVPKILERLAASEPFPARAIRAFLHGSEVPGRQDPARTLALLATLLPSPSRDIKRLAAHMIGVNLLVHRTEETANLLVGWLGRKGLDRVVRAAFRELRRSLTENGHRRPRLRDRILALRSHPDIAQFV